MFPIESMSVKSALESILASKNFKQSQVLSNFLRYVVTETLEGKSNEIKEYSIAVKALGKPGDFNPQLDALIRIHAGRLRRSMDEYYHSEGANDTVIISLEKGSYIPVFFINDKKNKSNGNTYSSNAKNKELQNTVAVLPFKNISGNAGFDFMVDGFCEQLSSDLAQFQELSVVSYFSSSRSQYREKDISLLPKELNASYFITGSIYRDKKHLRVAVQLSGAESGFQLWTHTYEYSLQTAYYYEIFDDIIKQVIARVGGYQGAINRNTAPSLQTASLKDLQTADAVFWFYHYHITYTTEEVFQLARMHLEKAVESNPGNALPWAVLAELYIDGEMYGFKNVNDPLQEAERCVRKSLQINPDCQHAHMSLGWLYVVSHRDKDRAFKSFEYCLSINPKSAFFLGAISFGMACVGEYDKSISLYEQSIILNPFMPWWFNVGPVFAHFYNGNYERALEFANHINVPLLFWDPIFKISALGQLLRIEEASAMADKFQRSFPGVADMVPFSLRAMIFDDTTYNNILEGLNKAGLCSQLGTVAETSKKQPLYLERE